MRKLMGVVVRWVRRLFQKTFRRRKMHTLNERFMEFCRHFPGAEPIDSIQLTPQQDARRVAANLRRADFFFEGRTIICEVKALEIDTTDKLLEVMNAAGVGPDDLPKGMHIIDALFQAIPKGSKLLKHAMKLVLVPFTNHFNKAVTQLRDTKIIFDLPDADGLFVLLNDSLPLGGPPLIYKRLRKRLLKHDGKGQPFHKDLTRVLYVGETPHLYETPAGDVHVNVTLPNPYSAEKHDLEKFVFKLNEAWAAFNGQTFMKAGDEVGKLLENSKLYIDVK
jgi:hypothetical protein